MISPTSTALIASSEKVRRGQTVALPRLHGIDLDQLAHLSGATGSVGCAGVRPAEPADARDDVRSNRTLLRTGFAAAWMMTSQKHGFSALGVQRAPGVGSYQTARAMLHRYRNPMVRP